jgi:WD40 repeat protein
MSKRRKSTDASSSTETSGGSMLPYLGPPLSRRSVDPTPRSTEPTPRRSLDAPDDTARVSKAGLSRSLRGHGRRSQGAIEAEHQRHVIDCGVDCAVDAVTWYEPLATGDAQHARLVIAPHNADGVQVWCTGTGQMLGELAAGATSALVVCKLATGQHRISCGSLQGDIRIFDGETFAPVHSEKLGDQGFLLAAYSDLNGNPRLVVPDAAGVIRVLDGGSGETLRLVEGFGASITRMVPYVTEDRAPRLVLVGSIGKIALCDPEGSATLAQMAGLAMFISVATTFTPSSAPDQVWLLTGSHDGSLKMWDTATGALLRDLQGAHATSLCSVVAWRDPLTGADHLASASRDGTVKTWSGQEGTMLRSWEVHSAVSEDRAGELRDMGVLRTPEVHGQWRLVTASSCHAVAVWDADTGRRLMLLGHGHGVDRLLLFESGGRQCLVSCGSANDLRVWDMGQAHTSLPPLPATATKAVSASPSPSQVTRVTAKPGSTTRRASQETRRASQETRRASQDQPVCAHPPS